MLKKLLRFKNLKERNYVNSWNQLNPLIEKHGFPKGRYAMLHTGLVNGLRINVIRSGLMIWPRY